MSRNLLLSFIIFVLIPTLAFFLYAFIKIGDASTAMTAQAEIKKIVSGRKEDISEFNEQSLQIKIITDAVYSSLGIAENSNGELPKGSIAQANLLLKNLKLTSSTLSDAGYAEGSLFERVSKVVKTPKAFNDSDKPPTTYENSENDGLRTEWRAIWKSGENTYDIFFGIFNDSLTPPVEFALTDLFNEYVKSGQLSVHLTGFADRIGSDNINCKIAKRRLKKVIYFIKENFPDFEITSTARGELGVPFFSEQDGLNEPRNRIVRIDFEPKNFEFYGPACMELTKNINKIKE